MAGLKGYVRLVTTIIALTLLCVVSYYVLLYLVTPPHADGSYTVVFHNVSNITAESSGIEVISGNDAGLAPENSVSDGDHKPVGFFELPLWVQLNVLPTIVVGVLTSFLAAALIVRRVRRNENHTKQGVLSFIAGSPGCTAPELARGKGMNVGTARYHIQRLQDERRIVLEKIGKYTRIYVNSHTYDDREKLIASHLHSDSSRSILKMLMETPGLSNQRLSERLGMEKSLVFRYMQKLLDDRIVTFEWEGKNKLYYIDTGAREVLIKLMPLHYQCPGLMRE